MVRLVISLFFLFISMSYFSQDSLVKLYRPNFGMHLYDEKVIEIQRIKESQEYKDFLLSKSLDTSYYEKVIGSRLYILCDFNFKSVVFVGNYYDSSYDNEVVYGLSNIFIFNKDSISEYPYCPQDIRPRKKYFYSFKFRESLIQKVLTSCSEQSLIYRKIKKNKYNIYYLPPNGSDYFLIFANHKLGRRYRESSRGR